MSDTYLLIPRMYVSAANAAASGQTINAAPISAAVLFGHAISRCLGEAVLGVAYLHHSAQMLGENFEKMHFQPQQRRGASFIDKDDYASTNKHALSLQPTASCHLTISLVLKFDEDAEIDLEILEKFLHGGRFAGGQIIKHGKPRLLDPDASLKSLPTGFWLLDRRDLMAETDDRVTRMNHLLSRSSAAEDYHSWLTVTCVGYAGITEVAQREQVRGGHAHFFSEPLLGLTQFVSRNDYEKTHQSIPFWHFSWPTDTLFLLTQDNT